MTPKRKSLAGRCGIPLERDRVYVRVETARDGGALAPATVRPVRIFWPDGHSWKVDSVYDRREFGRDIFGNLCVRCALCIRRQRRELFWGHGDFFVAKCSGLAEQMSDEGTTCVALLHDVVEDTEVTSDDLAAEFPHDVIDALSLLTHDPVVPYLDYVSEVAKNPVARAVKLADLSHNMDETRYSDAERPDPADLVRRREKYSAAMRLLSIAKTRGITAERAATGDKCFWDVEYWQS